MDIDDNTAYPLSSRQTPQLDSPKETRVDEYLKHLQQDSSAFPASIRYVLADGYYSKTKFINGVCKLNLHRSASCVMTPTGVGSITVPKNPEVVISSMTVKSISNTKRGIALRTSAR
ncbi:MAG: hypothetical protein IPL59_05950 [Candidatus Competibacteraceae bacterium]|nr:hypothetical protein [Candidatus Competibacteraceae bacterium]